MQLVLLQKLVLLATKQQVLPAGIVILVKSVLPVEIKTLIMFLQSKEKFGFLLMEEKSTTKILIAVV